MEDPASQFFREQVREQLKADWREHPELEWASLEAALDGDILVGDKPKMDRTTFCGGELLVNALITGLRTKGGAVQVFIEGKTFVVDGDLAIERPLFVERGDTIEVVVRGKCSGEVRFSMHGYELPAMYVDDAKRVVTELLEAS
jgi:hypothetical protein